MLFAQVKANDGEVSTPWEWVVEFCYRFWVCHWETAIVLSAVAVLLVVGLIIIRKRNCRTAKI